MPDNVTIMKREFTREDLKKIDLRIKRRMDAWQVTEYYKGKVVKIPDTWNSEIYP